MRSSNKNRLVTIGRVAGTKGVGSHLRVLPLTYDPHRFLGLDSILIDVNGEIINEKVEEARLSGKYVILTLVGSKDRDKLAKYTGSEIKIEESRCEKLPDGEYYHFQIIGLDVFTDSGQKLGKVKDIIETGSNDVYTVIHEDKEILIPAIKDVIKLIDLENERIIISPVKGLLDEI